MGSTLIRVSISTTAEAEDAVSELASRVLKAPASVYADSQKHTPSVLVYVEAFGPQQRAELRAGLKQLASVGIDVGSARVSTRHVRKENWAESWKRHFHPLEISPRLLILPSWSKRKPKRGQAVVILDPGLSFGTGHHATTAFCLEQIDVLRDHRRKQSLLDVGCGSGILSIAAVKLGYSNVTAFDFDPEAVRVAQENAEVNQMRVNFSRQDLTRLPMRAKENFDVVCANLISDLLIQERARILWRVAPGGTLVLAGILRRQFSAVQSAYAELGLKLVASRAAKEWRSGAFRRAA